jgi:hypothetical protein
LQEVIRRTIKEIGGIMSEAHYIILAVINSIPEIIVAGIAISGILCYRSVYRMFR